MKRLYNIDSLKFLCAFLVVLIHMHTPYQESIMPLTRCAVPCFFIISGYMIFTNDRLKLVEHLKRNKKNGSDIKMEYVVVCHREITFCIQE